MMDMMERMMGREPGQQKNGQGKDGQSGDSGGQGQSGDSDAANQGTGGPSDGKGGIRRVPKAAGSASREIPEEFRKAFDAYNRGAEKLVK